MINLEIIWRLDSTRHQEKYSLIGIMGYADSSYTKDPEDKKSIIRYYFFLDKKIVFLYNK